jgi:hypothetical protein
MKRFALAVLYILPTMLICVSPVAKAATVLDTSPDTRGLIGAFAAENRSTNQNFVTRFSIADSFQLTGMDSYGLDSRGLLGDSVTIRIFNDAAGSVGTLLNELTSTISIHDFDGDATHSWARRFASFSQLLAAGTYWIGMSGTGASLDISQTLFNDGLSGDGSDEWHEPVIYLYRLGSKLPYMLGSGFRSCIRGGRCDSAPSHYPAVRHWSRRDRPFGTAQAEGCGSDILIESLERSNTERPP